MLGTVKRRGDVLKESHDAVRKPTLDDSWDALEAGVVRDSVCRRNHNEFRVIRKGRRATRKGAAHAFR